LAENRLTELPVELGNLDRLFPLSLYSNKLTTLPESICELSLLEEVSTFDNQIAPYPKGMWKLRSLTSLSGDPAVTKVDEINRIQRELPGCEVDF
jgi:Leucine-rich repeat (LRR) protein